MTDYRETDSTSFTSGSSPLTNDSNRSLIETTTADSDVQQSSIPRNPPILVSPSDSVFVTINPLILVPPSASALVNMKNVKQLLQDAKFEVQVSRRCRHEKKKERLIEIFRNDITFEFTDSVENFKLSDWYRVVGVITDGSQEVFKKYLWKTPKRTFKAVSGVYFKYSHEKIKKGAAFWNVNPVNIHRDLRHKDTEACVEFWKIIEGED